jgi:hypothetical protein
MLALIGILPACTADKSLTQAHPAAHLTGNGIMLYAAGDIADCRYLPPGSNGAAQTAGLIEAELAKNKDAVILTLGDNTYPVGLPAEFINCYQPSWGRFKARTYPSPGNHDYYTKAASGYYDYFGAAAGPAGRGYYSVDLGKWHVISLNSNLKDAEQTAQLAWLKTDLDRHKTLCTLAYWHHPVFSSGGHGNSERMGEAWKMLVAANADLVLVGHDHDYERFAPQDGNGVTDDARGIRQFVVGTGGAELASLRLRKPNSEASDSSTHGILKLVLRDTGYEWQFLPVPEGGFTDSGTALCH